jgi:hypothetical protein
MAILHLNPEDTVPGTGVYAWSPIHATDHLIGVARQGERLPPVAMCRHKSGAIWFVLAGRAGLTASPGSRAGRGA